ncbi:hypothetical protein [Enterobacter sp.]|uniref:hypothetical protein n=1 Tax=Enterobacter sp. TaxID=42895 RepID=UPI0039E66F90
MKKNYAGMAEQKSGDCLMLGLCIGPQNTVKYLGDFSGGEAELTDGYSGYSHTYSIVGQQNGNEIRLYNKEGKLEYYLYGSRASIPVIDKDRIPYYPDLPLEKGQVLCLTHVSKPYEEISLKLNALYI